MSTVNEYDVEADETSMNRYDLKAGSVLMLNCGQGDDFRRHGPYRVIKDFNLKAASRDFRENASMPAFPWFYTWLVSMGFIEEIECVEHTLGGYSWRTDLFFDDEKQDIYY